MVRILRKFEGPTPPKEVVGRVRFYRRKIEEAFKNGYRIELATDNIVELLAFNLALNLCIERGIFDKEIRGTGPTARLTPLILKELGDMKMHYEKKFFKRLQAKGYTRRAIIMALGDLLVNGLIYQKGDLIGRGSCVALRDITARVDIYYLFHDSVKLNAKKEKINFYVSANGKLIREPPYKVYSTDRTLFESINFGLERGLIKLTKTESKYSVGLGYYVYVVHYEVTDLGRYFAKVMSKCEIADD